MVAPVKAHKRKKWIQNKKEAMVRRYNITSLLLN